MIPAFKHLLGVPGPSGFGSKSTADQVAAAAADLHSLTAIVTGATSGIGAETARALAKRGARLILPARSLEAGEEARARIAAEAPDAEIRIMTLDLSSLASVRSFAAEFEKLNLPLNLLINNAGKLSNEYAVTEDGIEMTFATNYLGHFLLTTLLLEKMIKTAKQTGREGRIVNVTSNVYAIFNWFNSDGLRYLEQINSDRSYYNPGRAYALSKLANVWHTVELAERLKKMEANVTVNCVHPGIVRTRLTREREGLLTDICFFLTSKLLKTIPQAAATTCYVATHPGLVGVSGRHFTDCNEEKITKLGLDIKEAKRLWVASEAMTMEKKKEKEEEKEKTDL